APFVRGRALLAELFEVVEDVLAPPAHTNLAKTDRLWKLLEFHVARNGADAHLDHPRDLLLGQEILTVRLGSQGCHATPTSPWSLPCLGDLSCWVRSPSPSSSYVYMRSVSKRKIGNGKKLREVARSDKD